MDLTGNCSPDYLNSSFAWFFDWVQKLETLMSIRHFHSAVTTPVVLAAFLLPMSASAAGAYHPASNEAGATYHPEHAAKLSRDQVGTDLNAAMQQPGWNSASRGAPWPVAKSAEPKTRAQVVSELETAMKHPAWNSVSRGAPWPPVLNNPK